MFELMMRIFCVINDADHVFGQPDKQTWTRIKNEILSIIDELIFVIDTEGGRTRKGMLASMYYEQVWCVYYGLMNSRYRTQCFDTELEASYKRYIFYRDNLWGYAQ